MQLFGGSMIYVVMYILVCLLIVTPLTVILELINGDITVRDFIIILGLSLFPGANLVYLCIGISDFFENCKFRFLDKVLFSRKFK